MTGVKKESVYEIIRKYKKEPYIRKNKENKNSMDNLPN